MAVPLPALSSTMEGRTAPTVAMRSSFSLSLQGRALQERAVSGGGCVMLISSRPLGFRIIIHPTNSCGKLLLFGLQPAVAVALRLPPPETCAPRRVPHYVKAIEVFTVRCKEGTRNATTLPTYR